MKVLVTGATGFLGKHLLSQLLEEDLNIVCTYRNFDSIPSHFLNDKIKWIKYDISSIILNTENLFEKFGKPDRLIHLAWSGLPNYGNFFHLTENLPSDIIFLEHLISKGLKDLTVTGTCFEYGKVDGELSEELLSNPQNPYAIAKDSLRKYLEFLQSKYSFHLKWLRLFYMYGEGQNPNSLIAQLDDAIIKGDKSFNMSGGEQIRDYLQVSEVAKYIKNIAFSKEIYGIINICSGQPVKLIKFVQNYIESKKTRIHLNLGYYPYSEFEAMEFWGDNNKLKKMI